MVPALIFHLRDYAPALSYSLVATTTTQGMALDKLAAAEREKEFEQQARRVVGGLAIMLDDIHERGIMEDNLAVVRRAAAEELFSTQGSIAYADREIPLLLRSIEEVSSLASPNDRISLDRDNLLREMQEKMNRLASFRDTVSIVHSGYRDFLEALAAVTPKHLTAEDFANVRQIDAMLAAVAKFQEEAPLRATETAAAVARIADDDFNARRALGLLGGLSLGLTGLYAGGPLIALIGSAAGAFLALRLYPLLKSRSNP
jgi:hypothetical protein